MNRRQFLQALASLGASLSIPVVLQAASAAQVDEAWVQALADPWVFEVSEYGTIVEPGVAEPTVRADVFDVWDRQPRDPEHLIDEVEQVVPLVSAFQGLAFEARDELEFELSLLDDSNEDDGAVPRLVERVRLERLIAEIDDPDDGWKALVRRDGHAGLDRYWEFIERWLEEPIEWSESDWFPRDWHGQGKALAFFQGMDSDLCDELGVVIVEGDCPGSSYFAAELRNELDGCERGCGAAGVAVPVQGGGGAVVTEQKRPTDTSRRGRRPPYLRSRRKGGSGHLRRSGRGTLGCRWAVCGTDRRDL